MEHPRYKGHAIVNSFECPADQLAVRLENGNIWHYELNTITPEERTKNYPPWIRREMCKRRGKNSWKRTPDAKPSTD